MEDQRVTPEDLVAALEAVIKALKAKICDAVNKARIGRIIADSEEPVRDAHAVFRQQAYQKAIDPPESAVAPRTFKRHVRATPIRNLCRPAWLARQSLSFARA